MSALRRILVLAVLLLGFTPATFGQPPQGDARQRMWPAPSATDWRKPVLINWQRTWEDALAVSKETGKPIMVAINMDGEIASEHYAGIRYRTPEIAQLFEPYVSVMASVYRHTPRDHDENGQRVLCPRFGSVTCGEHIAIEPIIFEKYCDGQRVAPRHIMVELDGTESYDVFYAFDTASVFQQIRAGVQNRVVSPAPLVKGDRSLLERVGSKDISDRLAVEAAYREGDASTKRAILQAAIREGEQAPVEILRLAIYDLDLELASKARKSLAESNEPGAVDLIADTLRVPLEEPERKLLLTALDRLGGESDRAGRIAVVYRGLSQSSTEIDLERWAKALDTADPEAEGPGRDELSATIAKGADAEATKSPAALLDLAEAFLERARGSLTADGASTRTSRALMSDAQTHALEAEKLGADGWRVHAVLALTALDAGEAAEAHRRAELAVKAMPENPVTENSMLVLALFAEKRHGQIVAAVNAKKDWDGQWLSDMHAASTVLVQHPYGRLGQAVSHYDFLVWLDARAEAPRFLEASLRRFPESSALHQRFRRQVLKDAGITGLTKAYDRWMQRDNAPTSVTWYAALAAFRAAEIERRAGRFDVTRAQYARSQQLFEKSIEANADYRDNSDHFLVLIHAARARMTMERDDLLGAIPHIIRAFDQRPAYAAARDGLNVSPADTAKMLLTRLQDAKEEAGAKQLGDAMKKLDPELLELPAFERGGRRAGGARRGQGRRSGG